MVIDNGSGMLKAGFAGKEKPRVVFPSYVGRPKHERIMPGGSLEGSESGVVGAKVEEHRGVFKIKYALEHGVVTNWADMEKIWQHVYSREQLNISSEEHPVCQPQIASVCADSTFFAGIADRGPAEPSHQSPKSR